MSTGPPSQARETSGLTTRLIVRTVRRWAGEEGVTRMLALAGETRPVSLLEDEAVWSSYQAKVALFAAAAAVTGDPLIARRIGAEVLEEQVGGPVRLVLYALGTPQQLFRSLARAAPKFSTVASIEAREVGRASALVIYRMHEGYEPSRHDCLYTMGLLSQVTAIFGLGSARIEELSCQITGAPECSYRISWHPRGRRGRQRARNEAIAAEATALRQQLEDLQSTGADLVSDQDLDSVLGRIAERAGTAVRAHGYVLVVQLPGEPAPRVRAAGIDQSEAQALGATCSTGPATRLPRMTATGWWPRSPPLVPPTASWPPTSRRASGSCQPSGRCSPPTPGSRPPPWMRRRPWTKCAAGTTPPRCCSASPVHWPPSRSRKPSARSSPRPPMSSWARRGDR